MKHLFFLLFILISFSVFSEDKEKEVIVVLNLRNVNIDKEIADAITENLITEIVNINEYNVIERSQLNMILDELKIGQSDEFDESSALQVGKLASAKMVILGSISKIGETIALNIRGIEVETGKIIFARNLKRTQESDLFDATKEISIALKPQKQKTELTTEEIKTKQNQINNIKYAGIGLSVTGIAIFLAGTGVLLYDIFGYMPVVRDARDNGTNYEDYELKYNTAIGLLAGSISGISLGIIMAGSSIPLIAYKEKVVLTMNIHTNFETVVALSFNINY